jgi:hypothetical protein
METPRFYMRDTSGADYPEVETGFEWMNHALWDSAPLQQRPFTLFQKVQTNAAWGNLPYPGHMPEAWLFHIERISVHSPERRVSGVFFVTIGNKNWTGGFFEVAPELWTAFPLPINLVIGPLQHFKVEIQLLTIRQTKAKKRSNNTHLAEPRVTVTLWGRLKRPVS